MSLYTVIFSPTGTTKKVADTLASAISDCHTEIDLSANDRSFSGTAFTSEDLCILAVPSYGGRVPCTAAGRLKELSGNQAKVILVAVYGNRAFEDTLAELQDLAKEAGFSVVAGVAAVAEHSIVREFAHGRPDEADLQSLRDMAEKIKASLPRAAAPVIPGNRPYRIYNPVPIAIEVNENCVRCGSCAAVCPVGAISKEDPSLPASSACISCMRCVAVCPVHARQADPEKVAFIRQKIGPVCQSRKENQLFL